MRLSGQDSVRGTFSQRHSGIIDQTTEERYVPLQQPAARARPTSRCIDSALSEEAVLGFEYGFCADRPQHPDPVGSPVRRLRERRPGGHRPVHQLGRTQVAADERPDDAAAARLRGPGSGALLRPPGALPAALRRGQHAGRQLHHAGQLFPHPAPPDAPAVPQAADHHDAQDRCCATRRRSRPWPTWPRASASTACCTTTPRPAARSAASSCKPDKEIRRVVLCSGKVYLRPAGRARPKAGRDDVYILRLEQFYPWPMKSLTDRTGALPERRAGLVPGRAQEHGRLDLRRSVAGTDAREA